MRCVLRGVAVASFLAVSAFAFSTVQAADQKPAASQKQTTTQKLTTNQRQSQRQDRWRYTFYNGEWWYWLPTNKWVYRRGSRWNAYDPKTFTYPSLPGPVASNSYGSTYRTQGVRDLDNRPFYGHALSALDRRPLETNEEVGPFYGHALPSEFFGPWRARSANRPFYGHAISSAGD